MTSPYILSSMNQELLATTITFFKEQGGTYEAMHSQMLAGGIKEEEIQQLYQEIVRLGLDPHAQVAQAPSTQPIETVATPTPITQEQTTQPQVRQSTVSVASLSPFLANTKQGETFGIPVAPTPIPGTPSPVATATKSILPAILAILLFIGLGLSGVFAYAYLNPYTAFGTSISQLLIQAGLPGIIPQQSTSTESASAANATTPLTDASSTLQLASTTEATSTDAIVTSSSTQATTTTSVTTSTSTTTEQTLASHNASSTEVATSTKKK